MSYERPSLRTRVINAIIIGTINAIVWAVLPELALHRILESAVIPLSFSEIYGFGAIITGLQVLAALTQGSEPAAIFNAGTYVVEIYYIYVGTVGGYVSVTTDGAVVDIYFPVLVMLLMLYPLLSIAKLGITYMLEESEGSIAMKDEVRG